jgi:hypothetical protein
MITIDYYKLMAAVATSGRRGDDRHELHGWLNRRTGEIVFLTRRGSDAEHLYGKDAAVAMVFNRAEIEARSDKWMAIPKYEAFHKDTIERGEARERFALGFVTNCNLGAYRITIMPTLRTSLDTRIDVLC